MLAIDTDLIVVSFDQSLAKAANLVAGVNVQLP